MRVLVLNGHLVVQELVESEWSILSVSPAPNLSAGVYDVVASAPDKPMRGVVVYIDDEEKFYIVMIGDKAHRIVNTGESLPDLGCVVNV